MEYKYMEEVKGLLGIDGTYQDDTIKLLILEVIADMVDSGVNQKVAMSEKAIGTVTIGVNDLWNYNAGEVKHSPYFNSRCIKLSYEEKEESEGGQVQGGSGCECEPLEEITTEEIKDILDQGEKP